MAPKVPMTVAIKADKKAKRKVCERINMRRVSSKRLWKCSKVKPVKAFISPPALKA